MYILSNYDGRGAICVRLLTRNCLGFSHVCHRSHKSYSCKERNESTVQTPRLTFSALPSLLGCGSDVIRQDIGCAFVFPQKNS